MGELKPFVITRSVWLRGEGSCDSYLLRGDGKQCCLGQLASRVYGIDDDAISYVGSLDELEHVPEGLNWSVNRLAKDEGGNEASEAANTLMEINDKADLPDDQREPKLVAKFAELGYAVTFED